MIGHCYKPEVLVKKEHDEDLRERNGLLFIASIKSQNRLTVLFHRGHVYPEAEVPVGGLRFGEPDIISFF